MLNSVGWLGHVVGLCCARPWRARDRPTKDHGVAAWSDTLEEGACNEFLLFAPKDVSVHFQRASADRILRGVRDRHATADLVGRLPLAKIGHRKLRSEVKALRASFNSEFASTRFISQILPGQSIVGHLRQSAAQLREGNQRLQMESQQRDARARHRPR